MRWHKSVLNSMFGKAALAAAALGGFLFLGGASSAQAAQEYVYHRPVERDHFDRYYEGREYRSIPEHWRYEHWRHERYERERQERERERQRQREYVRGWYDRFGCFHRY
jgi:hypothetical protein